jgi:murein DD-endopeptidase MepM/ murein hydrolase activator NlpD
MRRKIIIFVILGAMILPYLNDNFVVAGINDNVKELEQKIQESTELLKNLREEASKQQQNLADTQKYASTLQGHVSNFKNKLGNLRAEINIKEQEIATRNLQIRRINLEINKKQASIDMNKEQTKGLFREIYKNDKEGLVELLFKYDTFSAFFNQVQAREALNEAVKIQLGELKQMKQELENGKKQLEENKAQLLQEQRVLQAQRVILDERRMSKQRLLSQTRQQESEYQRILRDIKAKKQEIHREVYELEEQLRRALDPNAIPRTLLGTLSWPTRGIITQEYGCLHTSFARKSYAPCDGGMGGYHNGLDIANRLGTPIRAAAEGKVVAMSRAIRAYGYWLAIEHPNGLVTSYSHMSSVRPVSLGEIVERGQLIGYMDSTGFSTGSHLHFVVYAPGTFHTRPSRFDGILPIGATLNPLDYLQ